MYLAPLREYFFAEQNLLALPKKWPRIAYAQCNTPLIDLV